MRFRFSIFLVLILFNLLLSLNAKAQDVQLDFLSWLEEAGYSESLIEAYEKKLSQPEEIAALEHASQLRQKQLAQNEITINFYEILANDPQSKNQSQQSKLGDLEEALTKTFGFIVKINYVPVTINYRNTFGDYQLRSLGILQNAFFEAKLMTEFAREFEKGSIVYWALKEIDSHPVLSPTGGSKVAQLTQVIQNSQDWQNLYFYAHEWGHAFFRLLHPPHNDVKTFMENSVSAIITGKGLFLNPIERYAIEPTSGFIDQDHFAQEYEQAL